MLVWTLVTIVNRSCHCSPYRTPRRIFCHLRLCQRWDGFVDDLLELRVLQVVSHHHPWGPGRALRWKCSCLCPCRRSWKRLRVKDTTWRNDVSQAVRTSLSARLAASISTITLTRPLRSSSRGLRHCYNSAKVKVFQGAALLKHTRQPW